MSRKAKKDDEAKLDAAQNAPDEAGIVAADAPGAAGPGPAGEAPTGDAPAGDEVAADAAPEGEMPGAADADAHAADGEKPEAETPERRIDANVLAAYAAASVAFGTSEEDATAMPLFDLSWLSAVENHQEAAMCAAAFARRTIAAPPETLVIHLRRNGFPDTPEASGRVEAAWYIFLSTLAELDRLDSAAADAALQAGQAAQADRGPRPARREDLAMAPADPNPLTDLGRRLQRDG